MRTLRFFVLALALGAASLAVVPASAHGSDPADIGAFSQPFREDGAPFDGTAFGGPRGDDGCFEERDADGHKDCLPAGASQNVLRDGRVLYWNAIEGAEDLETAVVPEGGDKARNDTSRLLTVGADAAQSQWATPTPADGYFPTGEPEPGLIPGSEAGDPSRGQASLFCSDQKQLANGTILAAGGTDYYAEPRFDSKTGIIELEGVKNSRIFDPATNAWAPSGSMHYGRWYPSLVTLPDGDVFAASGVTKLMKPMYRDRPEDSGTNVKQTETYDPAAGQWTINEGGDRSLPLFPRLHLLPNGKVYYDAAGQAFNPMGQSYDEALWNLAAVYDPATRAWSDLGIPGIGTAEPGFRGSTFSQMLPLKAPYTSASFLTAGGVLGTTPGSYLPTDGSRITTVDTSGPDEVLTTHATGSLGRPRWYSTAVSLPDGTVLAFSGADLDEVVSPGSESPIREVELFTPNAQGTGGTWHDMAVANRGRTYHNNAVLLPDGRVLVGGHAPIPNGYGTVKSNDDVPVRDFANNFKDASFEVFSPPYLFWGPRPEIGDMSAAIAYGQQLTIPTEDAAGIESVVLVRNPAQTHLIDGDQRTVELTITGRDDDSVEVTVPASSAVLPAGPYMLFINKGDDQGLIPSVSRQVFVGVEPPAGFEDAAQAPALVAPPSGAQAGAGNAAAAPMPPAAVAQPGQARGRRSASSRPVDVWGLELVAMAAVIGAAAATAATRRRRRPIEA